MAANKPSLTYFSSRGLAEPIRVILAEAGVDYDEVGLGAYSREPYPQPFVDLKASGVLPFGVVPLWKEDGLLITQSQAIIRHLGRKYHLDGKDEHERCKVDEICEGLTDFRVAVRGAATGPDKEAAKKAIFGEILPKWLAIFDHLLKSNHGGNGWLVGEGFTLADIGLWIGLESLHDQGMSDLAGHPLLKAYQARCEARPGIASWKNNPKRYPVQKLL